MTRKEKDIAPAATVQGVANSVRRNIFQNYAPNINGVGNTVEANVFLNAPPAEEQIRQLSLMATSVAHVLIGRIYDLTYPESGRAPNDFPPVEFMNEQLALIGVPWRVSAGPVAGSIQVIPA